MGTPLSKTFTVKNLGTCNLILTTPITVPAGFTVTSSFGSTTLGPGASTAFTIRMNATTAGTYSGKLSFANNDSDENPFDFTLSGTVAAKVTGLGSVDEKRRTNSLAAVDAVFLSRIG